MIDLLVVGTGKWAHECWAPLLAEFTDAVTVRGVADPDLGRARSFAAAAGLPHRHAYRSVAAAVDAHPEATAAVVLTGPHQHADCILALTAAGLDVLTEKPLVTTAADAARVRAAGRQARVAVVQNYRYQQSIQYARRLVAAGGLGDVQYVTARFAADYRVPGSWDVGDAHTMDHPLLVEASIHHLDMIRYLTGRDIAAVTAATLNPPASSFAGDCVAGLLLRLDRGAFALYEATLHTAGQQHRWRNERYHVELTAGSITCAGPHITVTRDGTPHTVTMPDHDMFAGHRVQLAAFTAWLNGGPPAETTVADNLRSLAAVFAAIESAATGATVPVERLG